LAEITHRPVGRLRYDGSASFDRSRRRFSSDQACIRSGRHHGRPSGQKSGPPSTRWRQNNKAYGGTVILEGVVNREGQVQELRVLAGPSMLQQAAIDAVRQWVYTPYSLAGKAVDQELEFYVEFALPR
jgi:TonB family protein